MPNLVKLIAIFNAQTAKVNSAGEHLACKACEGSGQEIAPHPETGHDYVPCRVCLGSGYNQLGLILANVLKPPPEGYGPVTLKDDQTSLHLHMESPCAEKQPIDRRCRKNKLKQNKLRKNAVYSQAKSQADFAAACQPPQIQTLNQRNQQP